MTKDPFQHEWYGQTVLHPLGLTAVIVLGGSMLVLPRRYAAIPILLMACFVAPAQRLVVFTLDFDLLRVMILFGWARLALRGEWRGVRWRALDTLVVACTAVGLLTNVVTAGGFGSFVNRLGYSYDAVGMYFLFRAILRDADDVTTLARGAAMIALPVAAAFVVENQTARNLFAFLGGVPEVTFLREGRLRCQGAFAHPILAGCFWAALLPVVAALWWRGMKLWATCGVAAALLIILLCASSTPVLAVALVGLGACMFTFRRRMRLVRWGLLFTAVALHLVMRAPVWQLLARVNVVGGSSGWHRHLLIDGAISHAGEWFWHGSALGTAHWGWGAFDVTNHYVVQGLQGGILLLGLFVAIITLGYRGVGRMWRAAPDRATSALAWSLGVSLFVHTTSFVAVTYFGQIFVVWYLTLAMIASLEPVENTAGGQSGGARIRSRGRTGGRGHAGRLSAGGVRAGLIAAPQASPTAHEHRRRGSSTPALVLPSDEGITTRAH